MVDFDVTLAELLTPSDSIDVSTPFSAVSVVILVRTGIGTFKLDCWLCLDGEGAR